MFWEDVWRGDNSFKTMYPRLYRISECHREPITSFYRLENGEICWDFHLRWNLNDLESIEMASLLGTLSSVIPSREDCRVWTLEDFGIFGPERSFP
jgi:hypothetical protein